MTRKRQAEGLVGSWFERMERRSIGCSLILLMTEQPSLVIKLVRMKTTWETNSMSPRHNTDVFQSTSLGYERVSRWTTGRREKEEEKDGQETREEMEQRRETVVEGRKEEKHAEKRTSRRITRRSSDGVILSYILSYLPSVYEKKSTLLGSTSLWMEKRLPSSLTGKNRGRKRKELVKKTGKRKEGRKEGT